MLWSQGLHNLTTTSTTLSCSGIASMTRHHCPQHDSTSTSRRGQVASIASSPAWLSSIVTSMTRINITPQPSRLGSVVASMTRHLHYAMAKSPRQHRHQHDSTTLLPTWLNIYIAPRPSRLGSTVTSMTRQHCRQHDSTSTSRRGQGTSAALLPAWLGSIVASMTQHLHHDVAKSSQ
jgi:hypothetical protein